LFVKRIAALFVITKLLVCRFKELLDTVVEYKSLIFPLVLLTYVRISNDLELFEITKLVTSC
jgi:hypothetical protein